MIVKYVKMKFLKSKLLQKAKGSKRGKYQLLLEVTDYDIEMLENLATVHICNNYLKCQSDDCIKLKYRVWLRRVYHEFWKLWRDYDDF